MTDCAVGAINVTTAVNAQLHTCMMMHVYVRDVHGASVHQQNETNKPQK